jgi:hypothetical protein
MKNRYKILSLKTKNILKKGTVEILCMIIVGGVFFYGCKKDNSSLKGEINTEQVIEKEQKVWQWLKDAWAAVKAAVGGVEVNYQTGYWKETIEYYENGVVKKHEKECKEGGAVCTLSIKVGSTNLNLSSDDDDDVEYPNLVEPWFVVDGQNNVMLVVHYNSNPEACNQFFYSDVIEFTYPYVINNPEILAQLYQTKIIRIFGSYNVHTVAVDDEILKYIILTSNTATPQVTID